MKKRSKHRAAKRSAKASRELAAAPPRTTTIRFINNASWDVPRGFGKIYREIAIDHENAIARGDAEEVYREVRDLLELVGYTASDDVISTWSPRKRVEAVAWAANAHLRASDNPIQQHPPLAWLGTAWRGTPHDGSAPHIRPDLQGAFAGPRPTSITHDSQRAS